jgi:2-haloacid dehalogenase
LLKQYKIEGLSEEEKLNWVRVWRRLRPWPDSVEGLSQIKRKYIISPMANGNVGLMTSLPKFAGLLWDLILGSDNVRHYKPDREPYMSAPFYLELKPEEVMICAVHLGDVEAARGCGMATGFIYSPNEFGRGHVGVPDKANPGDFGVVSESKIDLALRNGRLNCQKATSAIRHLDTSDFLIDDDVIADHPPTQVLNRPVANNWMFVLGECRGKRFLV